MRRVTDGLHGGVGSSDPVVHSPGHSGAGLLIDGGGGVGIPTLGLVGNDKGTATFFGGVQAVEYQVERCFVIDLDVPVTAQDPYLAPRRGAEDVSLDLDVTATHQDFSHLNTIFSCVVADQELVGGSGGQGNHVAGEQRTDIVDLVNGRCADIKDVVGPAALHDPVNVDVLGVDEDLVSIDTDLIRSAVKIVNAPHLPGIDSPDTAAGLGVPDRGSFPVDRVGCHAVDEEHPAGDNGHVLGPYAGKDLDISLALPELGLIDDGQASTQVVDVALDPDIGPRVGIASVQPWIEIGAYLYCRIITGVGARELKVFGRHGDNWQIDIAHVAAVVVPGVQYVLIIDLGGLVHDVTVEPEAAVHLRYEQSVDVQERRGVVDDSDAGVPGSIKNTASGELVTVDVDDSCFSLHRPDINCLHPLFHPLISEILRFPFPGPVNRFQEPLFQEQRLEARHLAEIVIPESNVGVLVVFVVQPGVLQFHEQIGLELFGTYGEGDKDVPRVHDAGVDNGA